MAGVRAMTRICFAKGRSRDCYGRITVHHVVSQQRLKRRFPVGARLNPVTGAKYIRVLRRDLAITGRDIPLRTILGDPRNHVDVCFGDHQLVEGGSLSVGPRDLPEGFWSFVRDYDLWGDLPRHLQEVAA